MVDTVVPIPTRELADPVDELMIYTCLIVQGQLDVDALSAALSKLVDHWPILGARLRRRGKGGLERCIPPQFSKDRPRFTLTVEKHDTPIPEAGLPPRVAGVQASMASHLHLFLSDSSPRVTSDLLKRKDAPIISLHINGFTDVTCIGFGIPHAVVDVPGMGNILRAWTSVLAGDFLPSPHVQGDPLANFGDPLPKTKAEIKKHRQGMKGSYQLWNIWQKLRYYSWILVLLMLNKEVDKLVFIPQHAVDNLLQKAMEAQKENSEEAIRLSKNDILVAIITKLYLFNRSINSRPLTVSLTATLRGQIPELPKDEGSRYIHNAHLPLCAPALAIKDAKDMSITEIALHIRRTVIEQRTPEELAKVAPLFNESARRKDFPAYFDCTGSGHHVTSWVAGGFGRSGKVIFAGGESKIPGSDLGSSICTFVLSQAPTDSFGEGGYWLSMSAFQSAWPKIEEYIASLV
ncbi:hypothetical protein BDZ89DRAFT_1074626 [Hymenopellis radicata]|nr:hypothetical protein BDZ89DRAFT_1074626 [Hymenopellis radicata]